MFLYYYLINIWNAKQSWLKKTLSHTVQLAHLRVFIWKIFISLRWDAGKIKWKLDFEPKSPSVTRKVCYHYNSWLTGVHRTCLFHINFGGKISQTKWLFESNLRSFGHFQCSTAVGLPLNPSYIGNLLPRVGWALKAKIITWRSK